MSSSHDKVVAGERFQPNARLHNQLVEALLRQPNQTPETPYGNSRESFIPIRIQSSTEESPGTVVGFGDPIGKAIDAEGGLEQPVFEKQNPAEGTWAVATGGMLPEEAAECVLVGVAWAQVNIIDAAHNTCDIQAGALRSGEGGYAKILYKPAGTGLMWCCLQLGVGGSGGDTCNDLINMVESQYVEADQDDSLVGVRNTGPGTFACLRFKNVVRDTLANLDDGVFTGAIKLVGINPDNNDVSELYSIKDVLCMILALVTKALEGKEGEDVC